MMNWQHVECRLFWRLVAFTKPLTVAIGWEWQSKEIDERRNVTFRSKCPAGDSRVEISNFSWCEMSFFMISTLSVLRVYFMPNYDSVSVLNDGIFIHGREWSIAELSKRSRDSRASCSWSSRRSYATAVRFHKKIPMWHSWNENSCHSCDLCRRQRFLETSGTWAHRQHEDVQCRMLAHRKTLVCDT